MSISAYTRASTVDERVVCRCIRLPTVLSIDLTSNHTIIYNRVVAIVTQNTLLNSAIIYYRICTVSAVDIIINRAIIYNRVVAFITQKRIFNSAVVYQAIISKAALNVRTIDNFNSIIHISGMESYITINFYVIRLTVMSGDVNLIRTIYLKCDLSSVINRPV